MARRRNKPIQQELRFRSWGGTRPGAGRPASKNSGVSHLKRPKLAARYPAHVTLKVKPELRSLRTKGKAKVIREAIVRSCNADNFRIIDWSIQGDHLHLTVEAQNTERLSRGMQGLTIRMARGLNRQLSRRGKVFVDRYHVHVLKTPREVRNARAYVMNNARRHAAQRGRTLQRDWVDPFSSWAWFEGWKDCPRSLIREARAGPELERPTAEPRTWLMRSGWRRHGLVRIDEVPGGCMKQ